MADAPKNEGVALLRKFMDRGFFREFMKNKSLTEEESLSGIAVAEFTFGPHHRNLACIGLYNIIRSPSSGYSALPLPPEYSEKTNVYKYVEVLPGQHEQVLDEGLLLLGTAATTPCVVELRRIERGLWMRVWTRSEQAKMGRDLLDAIRLYCKKNNQLRGKKIDPQGRFLKIGNYTWDDLIVPDETKAYLGDHVAGFVQKLDLYRRYGLKTKKGVLFSGPPGTGKTLAAKVLASQVAVTFIWVTSKDLSDAGKVREVFRMARDLAPTILLFEDADLYVEDRKTGNRSAVMGEIFNQLDGIEDLENVLTIMTTNFPEKMERALIDRPGRFDKELRFENPDKNLVLLMVKRFCKGYQWKDHTHQSWEAIGNMLAGHSGAHVYESVKRAVIRALEDPRLTSNNVLMLPVPFLVDAALDVRNEHQAKKERFEEAISDIPDTPALPARPVSAPTAETRVEG